MSSICFSLGSFSRTLFPPYSFSLSSPSFVRAAPFSPRESRLYGVLATENSLSPLRRCPFSFSSGKLPQLHLPGLISMLQAHLSDTTRPKVFSRGYPVLRPNPRYPPPPPPLAIWEYAMYYALLRVSWKVLTRFSLAFCTYPRCFAARDDCSDETLALCIHVYVCAIYSSDFMRYSSCLFPLFS